MYKQKYAQLHEYVLQTYENEKNLLKKAKQLNQELLGEKIKMEKQNIRKHEETSVCANLEKEKEKGMKELFECNERDTMLQYELAELTREHAEHARMLEVMRKENEALVDAATGGVARHGAPRSTPVEPAAAPDQRAGGVPASSVAGWPRARRGSRRRSTALARSRWSGRGGRRSSASASTRSDGVCAATTSS